MSSHTKHRTLIMQTSSNLTTASSAPAAVERTAQSISARAAWGPTTWPTHRTASMLRTLVCKVMHLLWLTPWLPIKGVRALFFGCGINLIWNSAADFIAYMVGHVHDEPSLGQHMSQCNIRRYHLSRLGNFRNQDAIRAQGNTGNPKRSFAKTGEEQKKNKKTHCVWSTPQSRSSSFLGLI